MEYRIEPFELLTTALSALEWRRENGSIRMICDTPAKRYYESLGLCFLWDDGVYPLLDTMPEDINATAFWAAGKLYALSAVPSPCVMLDTDFICWKSISNLLDGPDTAAIHREDIMPSIYPDQTAFAKTEGFPLDSFDWTVQPFNTALAYFGNDEFRRYYTDTAIRFMRCSPDADDTLTYMVFAEQRLLAMCAEKKHAHAAALSDLPALFGGAQNGYFTHIWGFKQQMRENPELYEDFCRRCAARLQKDFPEESKTIAKIAELSPFFA
ncbi:hypothetical protein [Agathobaculum butyriciproducens]